MSSRLKHRGFTLIELLVTIAIIAVLMAQLLPAVMQVREAARRTQCKNGLRQLGIALSSYHDAETMLPAGCVNPRGPIARRPAGFHHSWIWAILPHIDQQAAYNALDQNRGAYDPANRRMAKLVIPILICSSDMTARTSIDRTMRGAGLTNYAGVHHPVEAPIDTTNHGSFYVNSFLKYDEFADGTTYTIGIGEIPRDQTDLGWVSGTRSTLRNAGEFLSSNRMQTRPFANDPATVVDSSPAAGEEVLQEVWEAPAADSDGDLDGLDAIGVEQPPPMKEEGALLRPPAPPVTVNLDYSVGGFGSNHTGGAHFLVMDGGCRFLSENTAPLLFRQLADRADGAVTEEF